MDEQAKHDRMIDLIEQLDEACHDVWGMRATGEEAIEKIQALIKEWQNVA